MQRNPILYRQKTAQYIFLLPGLLFFSFSILLPFFMGINIAFTDWNGITRDYHYVGLKNFIGLFQDPRILAPVRNSLEFALLGTLGSNAVSLILALLVNQKSRTLRNIPRLVFFIPVCFSAILTAFIWGFLYKEVFAELFNTNSLLGNPRMVIPAITAMGIWNTSGINMLIYLAGLKGVPSELYEAAVIDGAGSFKRFRHITVPFLSASFTVCFTLSLTAWLREFAMTLSATGGGPGGASRTISIYIFENLYQYSKAGYGQAVALVFALLLGLIANLVSGFFRRREIEL